MTPPTSPSAAPAGDRRALDARPPARGTGARRAPRALPGSRRARGRSGACSTLRAGRATAPRCWHAAWGRSAGRREHHRPRAPRHAVPSSCGRRSASSRSRTALRPDRLLRDDRARPRPGCGAGRAQPGCSPTTGCSSSLPPTSNQYLVDNEFHEREFLHEEFVVWLGRCFASVDVLLQHNFVTSAVSAHPGPPRRAGSVPERVPAFGGPGEELYTVALCGSGGAAFRLRGAAWPRESTKRTNSHVGWSRRSGLPRHGTGSTRRPRMWRRLGTPSTRPWSASTAPSGGVGQHRSAGWPTASGDEMADSVTVAIPVLNGGRLLREVLESVAAQRLDRSVELLVADRGRPTALDSGGRPRRGGHRRAQSRSSRMAVRATVS